MKYYLLIFLIATLFLTFVLPTLLTYRRTGTNPVTFGKEDNAHNYIGKWFKIILGLLILVVAANAFTEGWSTKYVLPVHYLEKDYINYTGWILLHLSLIWILIAQYQMHNSWRIGIDEKNKTELVTKGLFSVSRNPIFLGMIVSMLGAFLVLPNAITFFIAIASYLLIQIQIRLEEEHLQRTHGDVYSQYKKKTGRLL